MKVQVLPTSLVVRNFARSTVVGCLTLAGALVGMGAATSSATVQRHLSLGAANREGTFTLGDLLARGTLILEFLRGTW